MTSKKRYDYIIAGAGCAGLSLAVHLIRSGQFREKKILLIDREEKNRNDRTWCFWETQPGFFEDIVYHRWPKAWFHGSDFSRLLSLDPYEYKLIRGIDFYRYCLDLIGRQPNVDRVIGHIDHMQSDDEGTFIHVDAQEYHATYIFNSLLEKPVLGKREYLLLQHFTGWVVETEAAIFDPGTATLMDFRVGQENGTSFVYVMPFSPTRALVEYTLFTEKLLEPQQYSSELRNYLTDFLQTTAYNVIEEETGVIPMTNHRFPRQDHHIIHLGTAGGQTKASSGYTFHFIQKHAAAITKRLIGTGDPFVPLPAGQKRFDFYDSVLLNILHNKALPGRDIFSPLFKINEPRRMLRFLDNESSLRDELRIISSLPAWPFFKAALRQL